MYESALDASKAFDRISHNLLIKKLMSLLRRHIGFGSSSRLTCACLSVGSVGRVEYIIICF